MASKGRKSKKKQKMILILAVVLLIVIVALLTVVTTVVRKYSPSDKKTDYASYYNLSEKDALFVIYNEEQMEENGILADGEAYIPYQVVRKSINSRFYWDESEQILRYTIPEGVISTQPDTKQYTIGKERKQAEKNIVLVQNDEMYLSLSFMKQYTNIRSEVFKDPNRVVIADTFGDVKYSTVKKNTQIRQKAGVKSAILKEVKKGDLVTVKDTLSSWVKVCSQDGFIGYMKKRALGNEQEILYDSTYKEPTFSHAGRSDKVNLAWHQVTNQTANGNVSTVLSRTKGVNVISPTWFQVSDDKGDIVSLASTSYVNYCHERNVEVWGLVSNLEKNVDITSVLSKTSSRDRLVNNLIAEAIKYDLDGINVDFESLKSKAGAGYLQFIRELSLKCKNNDLILSVDNYVPTAYTAFYNRKEQAVFADYIIVMAYDEHYKGSEEGSVASLSYVQDGIANTLKEVPADQVILGIPFYTRIWKLTPDAQSGTSYQLSSETAGMSEAESRVAANGANMEWLDDCGQYYAEYQYEGSTYKIWLEEQNSIEKKLGVMKANHLAGAAFWKLGYEKNSIWDTVAKYMK